MRISDWSSDVCSSDLNLSGQLHAVSISHVVMCAPFAMAIVRLRLSQMDPSLEAAAWNLGASEWMALWKVIIPFCRPAIFAALFITMAVWNIVTTSEASAAQNHNYDEQIGRAHV